MTRKRDLPERLSRPLALRKKDVEHPGRLTILAGGPDPHYLDVPRVLEEMRERFKLLFGHYGIAEDDDDAWKRLAVALAFNYVPGFQLTQPGRPRAEPGNLIERFEALRHNGLGHRRTNRQIAEIIAKKDGTVTATVLRRYNSEKKKMHDAERKRRWGGREPMHVMTPNGLVRVRPATIKSTILGSGNS